MKKAITIAAAALLLVAGAMNLSAKNCAQDEKTYCYGFITSCGIEACLEFPFELDAEFCVVYLDNLEDYYCN
ncbi:MAG: hypothetical protein IJ714_03950 [Bacteroidales bacterium]|nr:hypothetical protein [Bacteroidales bacterium]